MGTPTAPRFGSLQFWPRKRASKLLSSVNWSAFEKQKTKKDGLLGFIAYKVGMKSAYVKDNTPDSMTKNKKIIIPVTILEIPPIKILSARFYKNGNVAKEVLNENLDNELKRKIKLPKQPQAKKLEEIEKNINEIDDVRIIAYSTVKKTGLKKTPDVIEIGIGGDKNKKLEAVKSLWNKEIYFSEIFKNNEIVDIRSVTKGKGNQGPVKRFGIGLKDHKSEKGVRRPGSLGPWHPARVTFRTPLAGQTGLQSRPQYNSLIVGIGKIGEKNINPSSGFSHYGIIKTDYVLLRGSVNGPQKRQLLITAPLRPTKKQKKKNFEFIELR